MRQRDTPHRQVIRDGRPCHLYMDLEYVPAVNLDADGDALVDALLALVSDGIRCGQSMANMACLPSAVRLMGVARGMCKLCDRKCARGSNAAPCSVAADLHS